MQVTAEQADPCTLVLDVSIDEQQVARAFDSSYREFGRYANVPGFRPGKAPRAVVERFVDSERVRAHTIEKIVRETYHKALEEQGVEPFRDPKVDPTDLEDNKPFSYKVTVPLEPKVTLGAYTGLTVEQPVFPVTDRLVDRRIERLREDHARLERVTDRPVQLGDVLIAETQVALEGDENPAPPRRQLVQLGNNIPGYDDEVVGMNIGEEKTFTLTYPDDISEEALRGKTAQFSIKLNSISCKRLPELDDEFAKEVSGAESVEELRHAVREQLTKDVHRISNEIAEQRLVEKILETAEIHYPVVMVREEAEERMHQLSIELQQNNTSYDQYLARNGTNREDHQAAVYQEAEGRVRVVLALREVAKQEKLAAADSDVDEEFTRMLETGAITQDQFDEFAGDPRRRYQVENALVQQRLHDYLFAHNALVEVEQAETPEDAEISATA